MQSEPTRRILLADCDSYFVRCAMLADPEGAGKADLLIVGGKATGRGVVTSASYGARKYGVHAGMPTGQALRLCPNAMVVPVPGEMVRRKHREVRAVLERFAPVVDAASVDEFYLDMTGTELLYHHEPLEETARRIQAAVMEETEIALSLGGSTQRILAKMAASVNKPMGVYVVAPGEEAAFVQRFDVDDIPGVGPSFAEALRRRGVRTVAEAAAVDEETLVAWVGSRGSWLHEVVHGRRFSGPIEPDRAPQKSVSHERTYPKDIVDDEEMEARLMYLATETGASLRAENLRGRTITVRVRYSDFSDKQASRTVAEPVESDRAIFAVARQLLRRLREARRSPVRLLHVGVSNLVGEAEEDLVLLTDPSAGVESERDRRLSAVSDRVRARFGRDALVPGRIAPAPKPKE